MKKNFCRAHDYKLSNENKIDLSCYAQDLMPGTLKSGEDIEPGTLHQGEDS